MLATVSLEFVCSFHSNISDVGSALEHRKIETMHTTIFSIITHDDVGAVLICSKTWTCFHARCSYERKHRFVVPVQTPEIIRNELKPILRHTTTSTDLYINVCNPHSSNLTIGPHQTKPNQTKRNRTKPDANCCKAAKPMPMPMSFFVRKLILYHY